MSSTFLNTKFSFLVNGKAILQYFWCNEITKLDVVNHIPGDYYISKENPLKSHVALRRTKEEFLTNMHRAESYALTWPSFLPSRSTGYSITGKIVTTVSLTIVHTCLGFLLLILCFLILIISPSSATSFWNVASLWMSACSYMINLFLFIIQIFPMIWLIRVCKFYTKRSLLKVSHIAGSILLKEQVWLIGLLGHPLQVQSGYWWQLDYSFVPVEAQP